MGTYTTDVVLADFANICGILSSNALKANSNVLDFHYSAKTALVAGNYPAQTGPLDAQYANYDATCNSPKGESASGGMVTITQIDSTQIVGSLDLTFNTDHVTGSFTAPVCVTTSGGPGASCQ